MRFVQALVNKANCKPFTEHRVFPYYEVRQSEEARRVRSALYLMNTSTTQPVNPVAFLVIKALTQAATLLASQSSPLVGSALLELQSDLLSMQTEPAMVTDGAIIQGSVSEIEVGSMLEFPPPQTVVLTRGVGPDAAFEATAHAAGNLSSLRTFQATSEEDTHGAHVVRIFIPPQAAGRRVGLRVDASTFRVEGAEITINPAYPVSYESMVAVMADSLDAAVLAERAELVGFRWETAHAVERMGALAIGLATEGLQANG